MKFLNLVPCSLYTVGSLSEEMQESTEPKNDGGNFWFRFSLIYALELLFLFALISITQGPIFVALDS